ALELDLEIALDTPAQQMVEGERSATAPAGVVTSAPGAPTQALASTSADTSEAPANEPLVLTPAPASALEKALHTFSSWPRALLPFMAQNVGWFIGVFCFLAGSVFLITYTSGFTKALVVCAVIFAYTLFSTWSGYSLRRKRPNLNVASLVLMTTGVLLVPLNFSAAARLLLADYSTTGHSTMAWLLSVLIAAVMLGTFYVLTRIVSGVVDRMLQGTHPVLFLGLSAAQLVAPLIAKWPHWPVLAGVHLSLSAVLGYALLRHARDWIRSILVDRRQVAFFAAGSLAYAFVVSIVHLTWGVGGVVLPVGYLAPYLMLLCGALFYLDSHFKAHADRTPWLSRFTFAVYALSAIAIGLSLDVAISRHVTLALGAIIYGIVVWRYLTFTPVYPLLVCLGGLYLSVIVLPLPAHWHFLATLPAILALHRLSVALGSRLSSGAVRTRIELAAFRIMMALVVGSFGWTLFNSEAGLVAAGSALALAGTLWWLLGRSPGPLFESVSPVECERESAQTFNLRDGPWLYTVTAAVGLAVLLLPVLVGFDLPVQRAIGLVLVGGLSSAVLVVVSRGWSASLSTRQIEVMANSALLYALGGVALTALMLGQSAMALDLAGGIVAAGSAACWAIALKLRSRALVYAALVLALGAGWAAKKAWFQEPSDGSTVMTVATGIWAVLIWLERRRDARAGLQPAFDDLLLLWLFPATCHRVTGDGGSRRTAVEGREDVRPGANDPAPGEAPARG
ncbi:MAG: hypothetical protein ACR2RL_02280, partial [Gammaproteobacteria bacterium]